MKRTSRAVALALRLVLAPSLALASPLSALAYPTKGVEAASVCAHDTEGRAFELTSLRGKRVVLLYEDRASAAVNEDVKLALLDHSKRLGREAPIVGVAVADVSAYDFWPAKGAAKRAVRAKARKLGLPIYCDWNGSFREGLSLKKRTTNLVVLEADGRVLFAAAGTLTEAQKTEVFGLVGYTPPMVSGSASARSVP
jgi:hypothetical protein